MDKMHLEACSVVNGAKVAYCVYNILIAEEEPGEKGETGLGDNRIQ